jgi:hypothetical protein
MVHSVKSRNIFKIDMIYNIVTWNVMIYNVINIVNFKLQFSKQATNLRAEK